MAAQIFGFDANEIKPQPGLTIRRSENGGFEANHEFVIRFVDLAGVSASFAKGQLLSGIDPDLPEPFNAFLRIESVEIVRAEGDLLTLRVTATGAGSGQFEIGDLGESAQPTYLLQGQLIDSPFSMHRKWQPLPDADKKLLGLLIEGTYFYNIADGEIFDVTDTNTFINSPEQLTEPDAHEFAKRIQQGRTTYQKSVYTWTETTEGDDELTPDQINSLGLVVTPRGDPPEPAGERDWMLTNVSQSQAGQLYRTTLEWTLSEEGGHDSFLYSTDE